MSEEIKQFIIKYISKKGKLPENINIDEFNYIDTGYIDSMGILKFITEIEQKFDIQIDDNDILLPDFKKIGGLVRIIEKKRMYK
jgi:acyl carrier protein